jgi:superkiller protein 3
MVEALGFVRIPTLVVILLLAQLTRSESALISSPQGSGPFRTIPGSPDENVPVVVARHMQLGDQLLGQGQFDKAIEKYQDALKESKKPLFAAYINIGYALRQKKDYNAAIESYNQAIAIRPKDYRGYFGLGDASYSKGDYAAAEDGYRKAIEVSPEKINPPAYHFLGLSLYAQKRIEEAIRAYRLAIVQAKSKYAEARYNLGIALMEVGKLEVAEYELSTVIQREGKNWPEAHFNLAIVLERQGKALEAVREYEAYLQQASNAEDASRIRARIEALKAKKQ